MITAAIALYLGMWSHHIKDDYDYNEQHDLVGIEYNQVFLGHFTNSYNRDSTIVGYAVEGWTYGFVKTDLLVGAATGYKIERGHTVVPVALVRASVQLYNNVHLQVGFQPDTAWVVGFKVEF